VKNAQIPQFFERGEYDQIEDYMTDELATFEQVFQAFDSEAIYKELQKLREEAADQWRRRGPPLR